MEHRYADESGPSWYSGSRYTDPPRYPRDPESSGAHAAPAPAPAKSPYDTGGVRLPEQRPATAYDTGGVRLPDQRVAAPEPRGAYESGRIPIRGPEYPAIQPSPRPEPAAPAARPTALVPPVGPERPAEGVYRTRPPVSSVILAVAMLVLFLPALRLLATVTFAADATARGIVPAVLLALGLALTGFGLFAADGNAPVSREAWLRPPLAYLPAGLVLLVAAGLAVA
ncbi:hypothetical protein [Actinoplanes teichomyceticus]|uniref:Uncharacterized protein n=1 Tax=Actinoplanes teichomyceticus TaxID=1867 RepID=A0A561WNC4_ACTTI|nr:hypothetical protein [Actinoplanes teichomyceticus]TWG25370.1 hypothetical protein FHX34_101336 [Actinoplanes teichomyceticus]GIF10438.1 hypothetical protein Ate01nite_04700 [Actinoplanes teichomyceticus]